MSAIKNGGPAFPLINRDYQEAYGGAPGMSLRDWFAGQALSNQYAQHEGDCHKVAEWAFHIADAMLAAREVTK